MRRAVSRAYKRIRGAHPRRPKSAFSLVIEISCDVLLAASALLAAAGFAFMAWAAVQGFPVGFLALGTALVVAAAGLLLLWEWLAWESFAATLSHLS